MFFGGEAGGASGGPGPIDHADVFVGIVDTVDIEKARADQGAGAGGRGGRAFAEEFDIEAAFLLGFAKGSLLGVFIEFDMAAERKPFIQFAMMDDEDLAVMDDEDGDGEIDFFVNVSHRRRSIATEAQRTQRKMGNEFLPRINTDGER